jgi:8-oxo-dGTP diphosphatase
VRRQREIWVYGVCRSESGDILLVPNGTGALDLPGGPLRHGEDPAVAVVRVVTDRTGLPVAVDRIRDAIVDLDVPPDGSGLRHRDCLVFDCRVGDLLRASRAGLGGLDDVGQRPVPDSVWVAPAEGAAAFMTPVTSRVLFGVTPAALAAGASVADALPPTVAPAPDSIWRAVDPPARQRVVPARHQRFAAYGLVTDGDGRVLLTLIADGYPGAGLWHLPGGGTDFGEEYADGLLREVVEETDQRVRITSLLAVSHRHQPAARGPEGVPIDWHGVRVIYAAVADTPTQPRVTEIQGSTAVAAWFTPHEAFALGLTEIAREIMERHLCW